MPKQEIFIKKPIVRWLSEKKRFQNPWSEANWALALQAERKYGPNLNLKLGWIF